MYSTSHSMSLSETFPTTAIDTVSEFTRRSATGNCKWRTCPRSLRGLRLYWIARMQYVIVECARSRCLSAVLIIVSMATWLAGRYKYECILCDVVYIARPETRRANRLPTLLILKSDFRHCHGFSRMCRNQSWSASDVRIKDGDISFNIVSLNRNYNSLTPPLHVLCSMGVSRRGFAGSTTPEMNPLLLF